MSHATDMLPGAIPDMAARARRPAGGIGAWLLLLVFVVAAGVYANSVANGFAFDDLAICKDNAQVKDLDWARIWWSNYWPLNEGLQPDALYRPLTVWTYLVNEAFTPGGAWSFHLMNVILHSIVTVLVALLAWRLLGDRRIAVVSGLLFAVHPLHTEAVANTVGRAELLAACWTLLALLVYLPAMPLMEEAAPTKRSRWHGVLVGACFFLAILSKETPATLLLAVPFIDLWRWLRWARAERPRFVRWFGGQFMRYYLPLGAFFGLYLVLRINACGLMTETKTIHPIVNVLVSATPMERVVTPFGLLTRYLLLTAWPVHLSADYSAPSIMPTANPLDAMPAAGILLCMLAGIMSVRWWRSRPQVALILGLFFTSYFLVSNAIRIGTIFGERLFYWPSAFVLVLVAWAAVRAHGEMARRQALVARSVGAVVLVGALGGMGLRTVIRNTDWQDNIPLAIATGRDNVMSAKACHWAGSALIYSSDPAHVAFGKELLERAVELYPSFPPPRWELAKYYGRKGELAKSLIHLCQAARLEPGTRDTRRAVAGIQVDLTNADPASYMPRVEQNLKEHPEDETAELAMAMALHAQKKYDAAEAHVLRAMDLGNCNAANVFDQYHEAAAEMAQIQYDAGKKAAGVTMFREYVKKLPKSVMIRCHMASMLIDMDLAEYPGALGEAEMNLDRARALDPKSANVRDVMAKLIRKRSAGETASAAPAHRAPGEAP